MKSKLWALQFSVIAFFVGCSLLSEMGARGELNRLPGIDYFSWYTTPVLKDKVFNKLRGVTNWFTDRKFRVRGPQAPKNKVVVVEIDNDSIDELGRWPWHRDRMAELIDRTFKAG